VHRGRSRDSCYGTMLLFCASDNGFLRLSASSVKTAVNDAIRRHQSVFDPAKDAFESTLNETTRSAKPSIIHRVFGGMFSKSGGSVGQNEVNSASTIAQKSAAKKADAPNQRKSHLEW